jgi:hypothetical protein
VKTLISATLLIAFLLPVTAQAQAQPRPKADPSTESSIQRPPLDPAISGTQDGTAARKRTEERERAWDRRMRDVMRGICTGC